MKVLLLSLMLFLSGVALDNKQTFETQIKDGYEAYYVMTTEETENYSIEIAVGRIKENVGYSIVFTSANPKEYELVLRFKGDNVYNTAGKNKRGDCFIYGIMPSADLLLEVRTKESVTKSFELKPLDLETYEKLYGADDLEDGFGNGLPHTRVKSLGVKKTTFILSIVFGSIILVSIIIIVILSLTKKGLFNKQKMEEETKDDFKYDEFINQAMNQARQNPNVNPNMYNGMKNPIEVEAEEVKEEPVKEEKPEEQPKEVYTKVRDYDIEQSVDVKALLEKNGFNTDYKNLSNDDKNKVMLELMRMKDFKEISEQDYRAEVIKLWM